MENTTTFNSVLINKLLDVIYTDKAIAVPKDFGSRCVRIWTLLQSDCSGIVNTILRYGINSASEANFTIECPTPSYEKLFSEWLDNINVNYDQIPTGIQELAKEYYKERWAGSSLCLMRATDWEELTVGGNTILVPKALYFVNGSAVWTDTEDEDNFALGSFKYYLNRTKKNPLPADKNENIIVQKPFDRWFDRFPTPYLIRTGVYKNLKTIELLQDKGDEVITKIIPYLFLMKKGSEALFAKGIKYSDAEMKEMNSKFKEMVENYKAEKGKIPTGSFPFDTNFEHLIPDFGKILKEDLFNQSMRAVLAGLGFVDVIQGISSTRKESILNPAPFVAEVNSGVSDFKSMIMDVVRLIVEKNKLEHKKIFGQGNEFKILNSPLKINVERMLQDIRSGYDRGVISIQYYQEALGVDPEQERLRRLKEYNRGDEDLMYPHLTQNQEATADVRPSLEAPQAPIVPSKPRNKNNINQQNPIAQKNPKDIKNYDNENQNKKKGTPEAKNFKNAELDEGAIVECPNCKHTITLEKQGYYICPKCNWYSYYEKSKKTIYLNKPIDPNLKYGLKVETTESEIRVRVKNPGLFIKDSFRTITLSEAQGLKAIIGKLKSDPKGSTHVQTVLFDKTKWDTKKAKKWVSDHYSKVKAMVDISEGNLSLEKAPYTKTQYPSYLKKYPEGARNIWIEVWNKTYEAHKDEKKAFQAAWVALKNYMKSKGK